MGLEIPAETEASLLAQARARGVTLDAFVKAIIINQAVTADDLKPVDSVPPRDDEELDRAIDAVFDMVHLPPGVGKGAMHRENWYT